MPSLEPGSGKGFLRRALSRWPKRANPRARDQVNLQIGPCASGVQCRHMRPAVSGAASGPASTASLGQFMPDSAPEPGIMLVAPALGSVRRLHQKGNIAIWTQDVMNAVLDYFADELMAADEKRFKVKRWGPAGQAMWESMAVLIGLRLSAKFLKEQEIGCRVRSNSKAAVRLTTQMATQKMGQAAFHAARAAIPAVPPRNLVIDATGSGFANPASCAKNAATPED